MQHLCVEERRTNMQNIKVIIGASYGDEGKGLATDYFGAQASGRYSAVNVLTNGGP